MYENGSPCPASELTLLRFIGKMSQTCQASTLKVYLAAVWALHVSGGFSDPFLNLPQIPLVVKGLRRTKSMDKRPEKLPISSFVLQTLKLQLDLEKFDDIMFWAACCTAFFGFLRAEELTVPSSCFISNVHLPASDISVDKTPVPNLAIVRLARSKTDQFGNGCSVVLARSDSALCPVSALMTYLRIRGMAPGPLFVYSDGSPLSKSKLNKKLQHVLSAAGWQGRFTLHSFRVGAASTAASLGFPDHLIKALGRWSSEAYQVYIRLPQNWLVSATKSLASAVSFNGS